MNHLNLNCEIYKVGTSTSLDQHMSCSQIRDPFTYGYGIGFNMDSKKETERHAAMYFADFKDGAYTSKQILSNTDSKYYEYIDEFIDIKQYTNDISISGVAYVNNPHIKDILINQNTDTIKPKSNRGNYIYFDFCSLSYDPYYNYDHHGRSIYDFDSFTKPLSPHSEIIIKRNRKTNCINARIVVGRINTGISAYSLIPDFDYDVKKVGENAIITVNVTETCIFR